MWAVRRASHPLRSQGYRLGAFRAASTKSSFGHDVDCGVVVTCVPGRKVHVLDCHSLPLLSAARHGKSVNGGYCLWNRGLSSQAGTESSGEESELDDGFSELENPIADTNLEAKAGEGEIGEGLVSDSELLSDDDNEDDAGENELHLSDAESEESKKKTLSEFLKVIVAAPRMKMDAALDKWIEEGNPLGRYEIHSAMLNLRKRRWFGKALELSEYSESHKLLDFVERDYASRLDLIAKVKGLQKAERYVEKIPESFRGEIIYRTLLANCVVQMNMKKAEEVFNKMRDMDLQMTAFSCNQLLLLYKRLDKKKIADVLLFMEKENLKPTLFTYKLLIDTKGQSNDISGMEQLFETMKAEGMKPDIQVQSKLAKYYIHGGLNEKAEAVLKELEGDNLKVNRGACRALLPLYADLGKADEAEKVWKVCESDPRLAECVAAIEAWGKLGKIKKAEGVFEKMIESWKKGVSSRHYTSLLKVYANHKLLAKGKDLAKRMVDSGCRIGPWTWDALVKLYVDAGEVEKADSILQKAAQQGQTKPLFSSYMTIMDQYAKRGDVHNAEKIFLRLRQSGYVGRIRQYQSLLQAYVSAKAPAYGFRDRMKADNVFPNKAVAAQLAQVDAFRKSALSDLLD
ncbi:hypothetical protein Syun_031470 [Stephania yunnanensis]|uniref:Pentatricopeptide repeat-containing protein n=1 Tax=Stephania yunnanensis TaxID=152371 RepID=A0AAP0DW33_9MAGN